MGVALYCGSVRISKYGREPRSPYERVMDRVKISETGCWIFMGATARGYGRVMTGSVANGTRRGRYAHVIVYEHHFGRVPEGMELDHKCRTHRCVNFDHLEPVTHSVNILRGESPSAVYARRDRCDKGHPYSEENTYRHGNSRRCRICARAWQREKYRRSKV